MAKFALGIVILFVVGIALVGAGYALGLGLASPRLGELESIIEKRDAELELCRQSLTRIAERSGSIGAGIDTSLREVENIADRSRRIIILIATIREAVRGLGEIESEADNGSAGVGAVP